MIKIEKIEILWNEEMGHTEIKFSDDFSLLPAISQLDCIADAKAELDEYYNKVLDKMNKVKA